MTNEQELIRSVFNSYIADVKAYSTKQNYGTTVKELEAVRDMAIKALEIVNDFERAQIITGGRLNGRTHAYKCGLADGQRLANGEKLFNILPLKQTDKVEKSNFSTEQYKADLQGAYDCGYAKALEQQTCRDCVDRDEVLKLIVQYPHIIGNRYSGLMTDIKHLPPVHSERPKGKWIAIHDESEDIHTINCSCCGYRLVGVLNSGFTNEQALDCAKDEIKNAPFCCKCGAEMEVDI